MMCIPGEIIHALSWQDLATLPLSHRFCWYIRSDEALKFILEVTRQFHPVFKKRNEYDPIALELLLEAVRSAPIAPRRDQHG